MSLLNKTKDLTKVGKQGISVKMPKTKKLPGAFDHPSVFFKSEDNEPKHRNLKKLSDFLKRKNKK